MSASSPEVFIVVDPVQDYEESLTILGVHGSLAAAKKVIGRYVYSKRRDTEIQRWKGDQVLDIWTYSPRTNRWTWSEPAR